MTPYIGITKKPSKCFYMTWNHLVPLGPSHPVLGVFQTCGIVISQVFCKLFLLALIAQSSLTPSTIPWEEMAHFFQSPTSLDELYSGLTFLPIFDVKTTTGNLQGFFQGFRKLPTARPETIIINIKNIFTCLTQHTTFIRAKSESLKYFKFLSFEPQNLPPWRCTKTLGAPTEGKFPQSHEGRYPAPSCASRAHPSELPCGPSRGDSSHPAPSSSPELVAHPAAVGDFSH